MSDFVEIVEVGPRDGLQNEDANISVEDKIELIDKLFSLNKNEGPIFGHLKISSGTIENLPRPNIGPNQVLRRMMQHINTSF